MTFYPPFRYINAKQLADLIKSSPAGALKEYAVVDVRSEDFVGGNIVNCINSPSETFHTDLKGLMQRLESVPKVIFHCALSQQRGPKAARIYAEARSADPDHSAAQQEIYVLRDGFTGFQQLYRNDPTLIEKFNKSYHD